MAQGIRGRLAFVWGIGGICVLLGFALYRLVPFAIEPLIAVEPPYGAMSTAESVAYAVSVIVLAYSEGYRAFQKGFSPRVVKRALHAAREPTLARVLFAPAFCMGLFDAERRRLIVSWCTSLGVLCLVLLVSQLPAPWRSIVDAGVVAGLSWGLASILWFTVRGLIGHPPSIPSDVPGSAATAI